MKLFITFILMIGLTFSQTLLGIPWGTNAEGAISLLKSKGLTMVPVSEKGMYIFSGAEAFGETLEVLSVMTVTNLGVIGIVGYTEPSSWEDVRNSYLEIIEKLDTKYTTGEKSANYFYPYSKGDGFTEQGVNAKKIDISTKWKVGDVLISVAVVGAGYGRVKLSITYLHGTLFDLYYQQLAKKQVQDY